MGKSYGQPDFSNFTNIAYNDPWFAVGMLMAQNWNKNYDERGIKKGTEQVLEGMGNSPTKNELNTALDSVSERYKHEAINNLSENKLTSLSALNEKYGSNNTPQERALSNISALNNIDNFKDESAFSKLNLENIAAQNRKNESLKQLGFIPTSQDEKAMSIAKQQAEARGIAQAAAEQRQSTFNADEYMANTRLNLIKQGLPQNQIEEIMKNIAPKAQLMQKNINEQKTTDMARELLNVSPEDPEYQTKIIELAKVNPSAADFMSKNVVNGRDIWGNNADIARQQRAFEYQQQASNNQLSRTKNLNQFNRDLQMETNKKSVEQKYRMAREMLGLNDADAKVFALGLKKSDSNNVDKEAAENFKLATKIVDDLAKKTEQDPNYKPTEIEKIGTAYYNAHAKNRLIGNNKQVDFNNYNDVISYGTSLLKRYEPAQIAVALRKQMGDTDFSNKIIKDLNLEKAADDNQGAVPIREESVKTNRVREDDTSINFNDYYSVISLGTKLLEQGTPKAYVERVIRENVGGKDDTYANKILSDLGLIK